MLFIFMKNANKKPLLWRAIYWCLSTLLFIALFLVIFGGLGILLEKNYSTDRILGFSFGAMGLMIVLAAIKRPSFLFRIILRKDTSRTEDEPPTVAITIGLMFLGCLSVMGGLIYGLTSRVEIFVLCLWVPGLLLLFGRRIGRE